MSTSSRIPTVSREKVKRRQEGRCLMCSGAAVQYHHRRSRSVRDEHTHCPCNGVYLCLADHQMVTDFPQWARERGLVVSRYVDLPASVPVVAHGPTEVVLGCQGGVYTL